MVIKKNEERKKKLKEKMDDKLTSMVFGWIGKKLIKFSITKEWTISLSENGTAIHTRSIEAVKL